MFVVIVWVLITGIVMSWYSILAPYILEASGGAALFVHALVAHWLLVNVIFHYYKVTTIKPGSPPDVC